MIASFPFLLFAYAILYRCSKMVKNGEGLLSIITRVISGGCEVVVGGGA